jgi:hypothetical protein
MDFMAEHNIVGIIVIFLMLVVLAMQIQMSIINKRIEKKEEFISKKIAELLTKKISQALQNK